MDTIIKQRLADVGTDLDATMARFMNNEAMYEKFLIRFTTDKNFLLLTEAMSTQNRLDAEHTAHTLKGVAANLGLMPLANKLEDFIAKVRLGQDLDTLTDLFHEIKELYDAICEIIHCL